MNLVNWGLVVAGSVLILVEVILGAISGFDFLLIGSAILIGGVSGLIAHSNAAGLVIGGVLSILYVLIGRKKVRAKLRRGGLSSNIDAVVGREALVIEPISTRRPGLIKVEGEDWRALPDLDDAERSPTEPMFNAGTMVRISRIDGVTAYVVPEPAVHPVGGNLS